MNGSVTDRGKVRMNGRTKNAAIDIDQQAWIGKELREDPVQIRRLPDIPQRLRMVQRDNSIQHRRTAIPGGAIGQVGAEECHDLSNRIRRNRRRDHVSDHHVAVVLELLPIRIFDPLGAR